MPSTSFIQKDFIDAFFGPTADIWSDLQNLRAGGPTAASRREPSLLEDTLGTECSNPSPSNVQSIPAPTSPIEMRDISSQEDGIQHLSIELDSLCDRIWDVSPAHSVDALTRKSAELSMRRAIHQALEDTVRNLSQFEASSLSGLRSKLCEFIRAVYGSLENDKNESRWQKLRDIDCTSFLFIGLAYTPVDIGEMGRTQFNYLLDNIAKFQQHHILPAKWFFFRRFSLQ